MKNIQNHIDFLFNDELVQLELDVPGSWSSTTTVLEWLRSKDMYTGTKEGCGEGDCGACTVVIAEEIQGELRYKSITSCIVFLPYLNGKQLITIEHLSTEFQGKIHLHSVQSILSKHNGSQCGFCTPGMVMSLVSYYKNLDNETDIDHSLSGNLCRCTGYESIKNAAVEIQTISRIDGFSSSEQSNLERIREIKHSSKSFRTAHYFQPKTLVEALVLKEQLPELAVVAGATDMSLLKTKKRLTLPSLLDISQIDELKNIIKRDGFYEIGCLVTIEQLFQELKDVWPDFAQILALFGSQQIRNMATVGGNLGSSSPIGDLLPLLMSHQTDIVIQDSTTTRRESIFDFFIDYRKNSLSLNEIITKIFIPVDAEWIFWSEKLSKRKQLDISTVTAAFGLRLTAGNNIGAVILAFGGMAVVPLRATETEDFLLGKPMSDELFSIAAELIMGEFQPLSDVRSSSEGRLIMASNLLRKFYYEKLESLK